MIKNLFKASLMVITTGLLIIYFSLNFSKLRDVAGFYAATKAVEPPVKIEIFNGENNVFSKVIPSSPIKDMLGNDVYFLQFDATDILSSTNCRLFNRNVQIKNYKLFKFQNFNIINTDENYYIVFISNNYNETLKNIISSIKRFPVWVSNSKFNSIYSFKNEFEIKFDPDENIKQPFTEYCISSNVNLYESRYYKITFEYKTTGDARPYFILNDSILSSENKFSLNKSLDNEIIDYKNINFIFKPLKQMNSPNIMFRNMQGKGTAYFKNLEVFEVVNSEDTTYRLDGNPLLKDFKSMQEFKR